VVISAILLALVFGGVGAAWALSRDNDPAGGGEDPTSTPTQDTNTQVAADEQCTEEIQSNERWVCLASATLVDGQLVVEYQAEWAGEVPTIDGGYHLHLWGSDGTNPPAEIMGTHAGGQQGSWAQKDDYPAVLTADEVAENIGDRPKVCAAIAHGDHGLVPDASGGYATGNCAPISQG
jgi:molecular chaperone DnaK